MGVWASIGQAVGNVATSMTTKFGEGMVGDYFSRRGEERDWQRTRDVATHKYQWMMKDMKNAGLNPMLAYNHTPNVNNMKMSSPVSTKGISPLEISAAYKLGAETEKLKAETERIKAETGLTDQKNESEVVNRWAKMEGINLSVAQQQKITQEIKNLKENVKLTKQTTRSVEAESKLKKLEAEAHERLSKIIGSGGGTTTSIIRDLLKIILQRR